MFRWIHENFWLPTIYLASSLFLFLGGVDLVLIGPKSLVASSLYAAAVLFARRLPAFSVLLVLIGEAASILLGLTPSASSFAIAISVLLIAAFANRQTRFWALGSSIFGASVVIWFLTFGPFASFQSLGILVSENQRPIALSVAVVLTAGWLALSWLLGRLAFVRMDHVGSPLDQALTLLSQARINLELARQNERLEIAKDLSELLIQRVGAVLSLTEGGSYAVKQNPEVASRVLSRASDAAKAAQLELRRLFELLHTGAVAGGVTPRLADLEALVIAYRELGYNAELRTEGEPFQLDEGAEMCLYKIAFESLENVRKHAIRGTNVTIEFTWVGEGLQLMVKDNGIEASNRSRISLGELVDGYGVEEDLESLVQQIDGATLNAMRERAALYEGNVEATKAPGVGFTVAAMFPNLKTVVESK